MRPSRSDRMTILVTGGLGFIGSHVSAVLARAGHAVRIFDDSSRASTAAITGPGASIEAMVGDVRDASAVAAACEGVDVVIHLAAVQGTSTFYRLPDAVLDVNLQGTLNVAHACARSGVRRLVFASSSEVYGSPAVIPTPEDAPLTIPDAANPRFSYAASKIAGELTTMNFARQRGFEYTILRYHNVYGPGMGYDHVIPQFIRRLEEGEEFTVEGDGSQTRAFCYIDDAVEGTVRAACWPGGADQVLNIGDPEREWTISELIALLGEISGKPIAPRFVPAPPGSPARRCPDISRARHVIDFAPKVGLREGLTRTYDWYSSMLRAASRIDDAAPTRAGANRLGT